MGPWCVCVCVCVRLGSASCNAMGDLETKQRSLLCGKCAIPKPTPCNTMANPAMWRPCAQCVLLRCTPCSAMIKAEALWRPCGTCLILKASSYNTMANQPNLLATQWHMCSTEISLKQCNGGARCPVPTQWCMGNTEMNHLQCNGRNLRLCGDPVLHVGCRQRHAVEPWPTLSPCGDSMPPTLLTWSFAKVERPYPKMISGISNNPV